MQISRIGIGVIAYNDKQEFLMGKRIAIHGSGTWAPPGGHLEFGESPEEGALRELMEEAGITISNPTIVGVVSTMFGEKHYITIFVAGQAVGTPQNCEPEKCEGWNWFTWDTCPQPVLASVKNFMEKYPPEKRMPEELHTWFVKQTSQNTELSA